MRDERVTLITETADGADITIRETPVWAERKSVKRSEYYQAYSAGLRPDMTLAVGMIDYESACSGECEPNKVRIGARERMIVRTYRDYSRDEVEVIIA